MMSNEYGELTSPLMRGRAAVRASLGYYLKKLAHVRHKCEVTKDAIKAGVMALWLMWNSHMAT